MDTTKLVVKIIKKILEKIRLLGNQKSEPKFLDTRIQVTQIFRFRYGSPFYKPKISSNRTKISFGFHEQP